MAKVTSPLFSFDARGSIAKGITFSAWKGINYVRQYFVPANPNTANQQAWRVGFTSSVTAWQTKDATAKGLWNTAASGMGMSGFNYYMREYLDAVYAGTTPPTDPPA